MLEESGGARWVGEDQQQGCGGGELLHVQRAQGEGNGSRDGAAPRTKQRASPGARWVRVQEEA